MTDTVPVEHTDDALDVGGLWTYRWGARKRPHLHPVRTPGGAVLTRDAPDDHPWHHGLWFTIKFVDEDNFWEEMAPYGVLRHDGPPEVEVRRDESVPGEGHARLDPARPGDRRPPRAARARARPHRRRRLRDRPRHHARADHRRALRPHAVHDLGRLRRPRPPRVRRLRRHPPAPRLGRRAGAGDRRAVAVGRPVGHGRRRGRPASRSSTTRTTRATRCPSTAAPGPRPTARAGPTSSTPPSSSTSRSTSVPASRSASATASSSTTARGTRTASRRPAPAGPD